MEASGFPDASILSKNVFSNTALLTCSDAMEPNGKS